MYEVWTRDAIDDERWVLGNLSHAQASTLVRTLKDIHPDHEAWMDEI